MSLDAFIEPNFRPAMLVDPATGEEMDVPVYWFGPNHGLAFFRSSNVFAFFEMVDGAAFYRFRISVDDGEAGPICGDAHIGDSTYLFQALAAIDPSDANFSKMWASWAGATPGDLESLPMWASQARGKRGIAAVRSRSVIPEPDMPYQNNLTTTLLPALASANANIGLVRVRETIYPTQLRYQVPATAPGAGGGGTGKIRIALVSEDGQNVIFNVTDQVNTNSGVRTITSGFTGVVVLPNKYWVICGMAESTLATEPSVSCWTTNELFRDGGAGHIDLIGTVGLDGGSPQDLVVPPLNPESSITVGDEKILYFQLQGAAF